VVVALLSFFTVLLMVNAGNGVAYSYDTSGQHASAHASTRASATGSESARVALPPSRTAHPSPRSIYVVAAEAAPATVRGGSGPVSQGAAGVQRTIDDIEGAGGRILGREVTVEAGGVRTRPDLFVELPGGQRAFIEVKTGPSAGLTPNQGTAFPSISSQGFTPFGANAAGAGLTPGMPAGPMPVWVVRQPWPF
jgi:hypothetical protein